MYLRIKTKLFQIDQPDEQIDMWHLGGDLAGWLCAKLLPLEGVYYELGPTMEDWGWTLAFRYGKEKIWINIWSPMEIEDVWTLQLMMEKSSRGFFAKSMNEGETKFLDDFQNQLNRILTQTNGIESIEWTKEDPR